MATGYFLIVITAMIGTFVGVGIADSGWLKKKNNSSLFTLSYRIDYRDSHPLPLLFRRLISQKAPTE